MLDPRRTWETRNCPALIPRPDLRRDRERLPSAVRMGRYRVLDSRMRFTFLTLASASA